MIAYTTFRKGRIRYSDEGEGRVIVLLHGFPLNLKIWEEFSAALSKHFRVIAIDLPGFGESESIGYFHSMELMAQCVHEVMRKLNLRRYIIAGHSMGGYAALAFGELFPENIRGLIMFHSTSYQDSPEKKLERDRSVENIKKRTKTFLKATTVNLFANPKDEYIKKVREIVSKNSVRGMVEATEGMKDRKDREIILRFSEYPVLFIYGRHDRILPIEKMLPQTEIPRDTETLLLEDAGHVGFYEAKEECLNAIIKFANRCFRMPVV